jgi:hypothetical protein
MTDTNTLAPCPFCGAGTTVIRENGLIWQGMKYGEPSSVSVLHHCEATPGQPSRAIERVGKDRASAIAAWNRRAPTTQAAPAPAAQGDACDAKHIAALTEIVRMPNAEYVADAHNAAVKYLRARVAKEGAKHG